MSRHYLTAEVSLGALAGNLRAIRSRLSPGCGLCAVAKADAYGHGLAGVWRTLAAESDALAVATIPEALELRGLGYAGRVLTTLACCPRLWPAAAELLAEAAAAGVEVMAVDVDDVADLAVAAAMADRTLAVHVKVDTGMGRSGASVIDATALCQTVAAAEGLRLAGVCTHFATADEPDIARAAGQLAIFHQVRRQVGRPAGLIYHAAASAAAARLPDARMDMVRIGLALYGYGGEDFFEQPFAVRPALRLTAPVLQVRRMSAGATCGYGCTRKLTRDSVTGIVPAGYGDGVDRRLSDRLTVGIAAPGIAEPAAAPVLGRVSMDQIIIDLTDIPAAWNGATAEIVSPRPEAPNSVEALARLENAIPYEITCRLNTHRTNFHYVEAFQPLGQRKTI